MRLMLDLNCQHCQTTVIIKAFAMFELLLKGLPVSAAEMCCLDSSLTAVSAETLMSTENIRQQALTAWSLVGLLLCI